MELDDIMSCTMVPRAHLTFLQRVLGELNTAGVVGDVVECGVWKGGCCMWMMHCQKAHNTDRTFYLYDTFDGMTFPDSDKDADEAKSLFDKIVQGAYTRPYDAWHGEKKWAYAPIDLVKRNVGAVGYAAEHIVYVDGDVRETLLRTTPAKIALLRLDTDWYESTRAELDTLYPKVVSGGYIVIDDYYAWQGSRVATDEFLAAHSDEVTTIDSAETGGVKVLRKL